MKMKEGFRLLCTLTRLLDARGRVRDGLLRTISDPVCS